MAGRTHPVLVRSISGIAAILLKRDCCSTRYLPSVRAVDTLFSAIEFVLSSEVVLEMVVHLNRVYYTK